MMRQIGHFVLNSRNSIGLDAGKSPGNNSGAYFLFSEMFSFLCQTFLYQSLRIVNIFIIFFEIFNNQVFIISNNHGIQAGNLKISDLDHFSGFSFK